MAGGTFTVQDKVRPGAYINIKGVAKPKGTVGTRGIVTIPMALEWGETDKLIKIDSVKFMEGKYLEELGLYGHEEDATMIREALRHSHTLWLYRVDTEAIKATTTLGTLTATARYGGKVGNRLSIIVKELEDSKYEVITVLGNTTVDNQIVSTIEDLVSNSFIVFSGTGELTANAGKSLEGGTSGTVTTDNYSKYLSLIKIKKFNTMGVYTTEDTVKQKLVQYIDTLRNTKGKKVQLVINDYNKADNEAIISVSQGYKTDTEEVNVEGFVGYYAGLTAGTSVNKSNTGHIIPGAVEIINYIDDDDIEDALKEGKLVLSYTEDEKVQIEQDINTLVTFTGDKTQPFSKNRVIRCLDDIANQSKSIWEAEFKGKMDNEPEGRNTYKSRMLSYLKSLETIKAIKSVSPEDFLVEKGEEKDAVTVEVNIHTIDSAEKLYMNVNVH